MKLNKLIFPLMIALTAMLATTGCKKGPNKITELPGQRPTMVGPGDQPLNTQPFNPGDTMPGQDINKGPGNLPTSDTWNIEDYTQDPSALAAYTVHFAFDSAAVKSGEQSKVVIVAEALKSDMNAKLLVNGYCDERGTEEYNRSLGERRALALREELAKDGVGADRIRTVSYGKDNPVDPGHDESAWSKNRRGEFILCHPKAKP